MSRRKATGATPAILALDRAGVEYQLHEYAVDPDTAPYGLAAATALGVEPERLFKTLIAAVDGRLAVGVLPVARSLDLKALASAAGGKRAAMADPADAERATGYVVGGISPLGQRRRLPMVVDETVRAHSTVYVSAGRRGLQIEVAPANLLGSTGATTAVIGRD